MYIYCIYIYVYRDSLVNLYLEEKHHLPRLVWGSSPVKSKALLFWKRVEVVEVVHGLAVVFCPVWTWCPLLSRCIAKNEVCVCVCCVRVCVCVVCNKDVLRVFGSGFSCCRHTAMSLCVQPAGVRAYQCTAGSTQSCMRQGNPRGGKERKCERWCVKQSSPSHGVYCVLYLFSSVITTEKMCESSLCWFMNWDHRYMILVEIIYCEGTV